VILVHGWGENAAGLGGFIAPLSEAGFSVVGFDLRGHGDSSGQTTDVVESAAVIREVAEHFGGAHAVIAHSMGANSALWALKDGLDVDAAVLLAPNVDLAYAMETFEVLFGLPPKAIEGLKRSIERKFGRTIWRDIRGDHLARFVSAPGLVFHDPDDPQVPFIGSQRLVTAWKTSELVETPGLGHGAITRDEEVIDRTVGFIGAHDHRSLKRRIEMAPAP
jgi:pimeloyl-ACP methyl ester carboxylesterase